MLFDLRDPTAIEVIQTYLHCVRGRKQRVGLTSGSFDLIHYHHFLYFIRCRRFCDVLIVGVDSDELVRERKGESRPIIYDSRRVAMVDAQKPVTFAFIMGSVADFGLAAEVTMPDVIFKNDSFKDREAEVIGKEYAKEIRIIRDVVDHSSTGEIIASANKS
ncbi:MAG: adenylyltransferase/cytidyltransferase family protein [bacterium]|nr:adenylyltransferase/cytidyltransferase family protein [bacterium]